MSESWRQFTCVSYPLVGALVSPDPHPASAQRRRTHCGPTESTKRLLGHNKALQETCSLLQAFSHTDTQTQTPHTATCWLKQQQQQLRFVLLKPTKTTGCYQLPVSASSPPSCAVRPKVFSSCANTVHPNPHQWILYITWRAGSPITRETWDVFQSLPHYLWVCFYPSCCDAIKALLNKDSCEKRDLGYAPALGQMHRPRSGHCTSCICDQWSIFFLLSPKK